MTSTEKVRPRALIVDDDAGFLESLELLVRREGFEPTTASSLAQAGAALEDGEAPSLVLVDLGLPDGDGWRFVEERGLLEHGEVIVITGNTSIDAAVEALRGGALDYLTKPFDPARLKACLRNVRRTRRLKGEIEDLRSDLRGLGRFGSIVGRSEPMQRVYDLVARVAPTDFSVLVTGESGVGKELVAETVHRLSLRRDGPLLPVNCGGVSPNLIESELFGHERGSFTGADRAHAGFFERCDGGTLFLDEVTEMSLDSQVKLLRVLESGEVTRVGGSSARKVDVRVVAACNRDPGEAVRDGHLREDLYYRLAVFPIVVPPLRERGDDVQLLAHTFLDRLNHAHETTKAWAPDALARLSRRPFPGNVRELDNLVRRAYLMADETLTADLLDEDHGIARTTRGDDSELRIPVGTSIREAERQLIEATLAAHDGDKAKAAAILGISLKTLYSRLKVYTAGQGATERSATASG